MADDDDKITAKDFEPISRDFVGILGLPEVILGALAIYAAWVTKGDSTLVQAFKTTDSQWIDGLLLACVAAVVGKLLTLLVAFVMAIESILLERTRYYRRIRGALKGSDDSGANYIDLASIVLAARRPDLAVIIERRRSEAVFAIGASLELFVLAYVTGASSEWFWYFTVSGGLMTLLGTLKQADYVAALGDAVAATERPTSGEFKERQSIEYATAQWIVQTSEPEPQLAGATRCLAALSGLIDALAIAAGDHQLPADISSNVMAAPKQPQQWTNELGPEHLVAVQQILIMRRSQPARLVRLEAGSLEGVIRDVLKRILLFERLIGASSDLLPARRNPQQFLTKAESIVAEAAGAAEPPAAAAAVLAVSGRELMFAYEDLGASAIGLPVRV